MFTIYADGQLLHSPHLVQEGCGVFSPKLTVELNKAGSLEYTMPPNHLLYDKIQKLKSEITVLQNGVEKFRGRVLNDEKDFYKQKKTHVEGELAYLLDSIQRPYSFSGSVDKLFAQLINNHNARVDTNKQFTVGNVTISGTISCNSNDYPNTYDEIQKQIVENLGGYLQTRLSNGTRYIDLIAASTNEGTVNTTSQTIEFGRNLLDITEHISAENIYTVLIPVGAQLKDAEGNITETKLTIGSVNGGKDYVEDTTAINLFGRIEEKAEWNEVENATELMNLGKDLLAKNIEQAVSLTVKAVDLHLLDVNVDEINVGDWVRVISLPHGLDKEFQCRKIVYDMDNPDKNEYSFGVDFTTLTEQQVSGQKSIKSSVATIVNTAGAVNSTVAKANQAVADVENVIVVLDTEYVKTTTFEAYKTEASADISERALASALEALVARVEALEEGGTT